MWVLGIGGLHQVNDRSERRVVVLSFIDWVSVGRACGLGRVPGARVSPVLHPLQAVVELGRRLTDFGSCELSIEEAPDACDERLV